MIDLLGFAGSGLIILSLTMKSIVRLRLVGLAGAVMFVSYGLWLEAWPVVATNLATSTINLVRLWGLRRDSGAGVGPSTGSPAGSSRGSARAAALSR